LQAQPQHLILPLEKSAHAKSSSNATPGLDEIGERAPTTTTFVATKSSPRLMDSTFGAVGSRVGSESNGEVS
jgi:hypothetical protein